MLKKMLRYFALEASFTLFLAKLHAQMAEWSIAIDCKSIAHWASQVRILLCAQKHKHLLIVGVYVFAKQTGEKAGLPLRCERSEPEQRRRGRRNFAKQNYL